MARVGEAECKECGCADAAVNKTTGGALQVQCHKCGTTVWGKPGTKGFRLLEARTRMDDAPEPAPAAKPEPPQPAPKPAQAAKTTPPARKPASVFSMGAL